MLIILNPPYNYEFPFSLDTFNISQSNRHPSDFIAHIFSIKSSKKEEVLVGIMHMKSWWCHSRHFPYIRKYIGNIEKCLFNGNLPTLFIIIEWAVGLRHAACISYSHFPLYLSFTHWLMWHDGLENSYANKLQVHYAIDAWLKKIVGESQSERTS